MLLEMKEERIPSFVWNSNPLAFKAALRYLLQNGDTRKGEVRDFLRKLELVVDRDNKCHIGIMYNRTGIFGVDDSRSHGDPNEEIVNLTPIGSELAALFDDNYEELTPLETVLCRGLQQQGAGYDVLHLIGSEPGIARDALIKHLEALHGGKGRYYAGYFVALLKKLQLVQAARKGRKVGYYLTVPAGWTEEAPEISENGEDEGD